MTSGTNTWRPLAAAALALTLAGATGAQAAEAMRVVRDPVTGELRGPTAAEAAAMQKAEAQLRASRGQPKKSVEIHYPDGTVETRLGDDDMMSSVVTEAGDGSLAFDCLPSKLADKKIKATRKSPQVKTSATASTATEKAGHAH